MKKFEFYKISPGGNMTILVTNPQIGSAEERAKIANILMDQAHLGAEQVGYIDMSGPYPRLDMMGGEFCGNASRSLAAVLAYEGRLETDGEMMSGKISVSGVDRLLSVKVKKDTEGFDSSVEMPVKNSCDCVSNPESGISIVSLDGITHILIDQAKFPFPKKEYIQKSKEIRQKYGLQDEEAVGCIWHDKCQGQQKIQPVVWVRGTNSTYYETACGSGTVALGLCLAKEKKESLKAMIDQPSGQAISVTVDFDSELGIFKKAWIGGKVKIIAKGETFI